MVYYDYLPMVLFFKILDVPNLIEASEHNKTTKKQSCLLLPFWEAKQQLLAHAHRQTYAQREAAYGMQFRQNTSIFQAVGTVELQDLVFPTPSKTCLKSSKLNWVSLQSSRL